MYVYAFAIYFIYRVACALLLICCQFFTSTQRRSLLPSVSEYPRNNSNEQPFRQQRSLMCIWSKEGKKRKKRIPLVVVLMMFIDVFRWNFHFQKFFLDTQKKRNKKSPLQRRPSPRHAAAHESLVTSIIHMYIIKKKLVCWGSCFGEAKRKSENTREVLGIRCWQTPRKCIITTEEIFANVNVWLMLRYLIVVLQVQDVKLAY